METKFPKQLGEFLLEKQEPFTLKIYLLERGHIVRANSCMSFKGTRLLPRCSQFVKAVFGKLALLDSNRKVQDFTENANDMGIGSTLHEKQVVGDRNMMLNCVVEDGNKQLSPVSVLEETESSEDDDYDHHYDDYDDGYVKAPQNLQKETSCHTKNMKGKQQIGRQLGKDKQLMKPICDQSIMKWRQYYSTMHLPNINHLLASDFNMVSAKEWRGVDEIQAKEIGVIICAVILEEVFCEIVRDMINEYHIRPFND